VRNPDQHDGGRLGEVERVRCLGKDLAGVAHIGVDVGNGAVAGAFQQGTSVREHYRVVVDVDDPAFWRYGLGDHQSATQAPLPGEHSAWHAAMPEIRHMTLCR
jgi:hypothetical protein